MEVGDQFRAPVASFWDNGLHSNHSAGGRMSWTAAANEVMSKRPPVPT